MNPTANNFSIFILLVFILIFGISDGSAQVIRTDDPELNRIDVAEKTGDFIPLDLVFINQDGQPEPLSRYFDGRRPVILVLAYYQCPMLCTMVLNGLTQAVYSASLEPGRDYRILTVSIDPTETSELALAKKKTHLKMLNRSEQDSSWVFFTGTEQDIQSLAEAIGFKYFYIPERDEFAHPAVLTLLSPQGRISRYLYGLSFNPSDLKLGLLEASEGKIGGTVGRLLLYCFHYDPEAKAYVVLARNLMKLGGLITLIFLGLFLGLFWFRER